MTKCIAPLAAPQAQPTVTHRQQETLILRHPFSETTRNKQKINSLQFNNSTRCSPPLSVTHPAPSHQANQPGAHAYLLT